jgi:hypothetical protein
MLNERDLVSQYKVAKEQKAELEDRLKLANEILAGTETRLIEFLEAKSAVATASYEGLGYVQIQKPRLYASYKQDDIEQLGKFLRDNHREDLLGVRVMPSSLASFAGELLDKGIAIPEFINFYFKPQLRLYS